ncbi:MAG: flavin reductase family protein [Salaquimonas sp.]
MQAFDPKALRAAFGSFMTGVTIVTARAEDGSPVGFTANSFTSVSMEPPLLLVCPGKHLSSIEAFQQCTHFAVNILREDQQETSNAFASSKEDRFSQVKWTCDDSNTPLICGALASFSCSVHKCVDAGDHIVLLGKVNAFKNNEGLGLGYWRGGYFSLANEREAQQTATAQRPVNVGAIIEHQEQIFILQQGGQIALPSCELTDETQARSGIRKYLQNLGLDVEIGRVYSVFHDASINKRYIYFRAKTVENVDTKSGIMLHSEELLVHDWIHAPEEIMVRRYLTERMNQSFGLYIGDSNAGEVHHENTV